MSQYYFLIAGLQDLLVGSHNDNRTLSVTDFVLFCQENMSEKDFSLLKKIFIFNDIKNVINYKKSGVYVEPAYYSKDEFEENLKDTDCFFRFIADFYNDTKSDRRAYPQMTLEDELVMRFYSTLDEFTQGSKFLSDYFNFELVLRNVLTIANMRKSNQDPTDYLIKTEEFGENAAKNTSGDFGLGADYPFIVRVVEAVNASDLVGLEQVLDKIRFEFVDNLVGYETFSVNVLLAYAVKIGCAARWQSLSPEKGRSIFEQIIAQIRENIKFSEEFNVVGGRK